MRSIILALAAGVALGASSYTHAQATKPRPSAQQASAQPAATYVGRKGEISAWDNPDFVKAEGLDRMTQAGIIPVTTRRSRSYGSGA